MLLTYTRAMVRFSIFGGLFRMASLLVGRAQWHSWLSARLEIEWLLVQFLLPAELMCCVPEQNTLSAA